VGVRIAALAVLTAPFLVWPGVAAAHSRLAPADEYFGRMQMSPIEITNRINDAERRGPSYGGLVNTQAAIADWTRKYPDDPWIPSREYRMERLFERLHSRNGNAEAADCRAFMRVHFPGDRYTVAAQRDAGTQVARKAATPVKQTASAKRTVAKNATKKHHRFLGILF
jgi:hypothetical protein